MSSFPSRPSGGRRKRRGPKIHERKDDKIYLEGIVHETLPGTRFRVKVERAKGLEPLIIDCQVKTLFKLKNIKIIKGDNVSVEVNPEIDIDPETNTTKGTIIQRH